MSPDTIVELLPIGQQQLVEIARALSVNARVLIMDEPTSSLSAHEAQTLFKVVKDLRSKGVSIIYISHRLGEVKELADRVTVFRDGENAGDLNRDEINHDRMVKLQVLFGVDSAVSGSIEVGGKPVQINSPHDAIRAGLALVPEDRKLQGLVLEMAVRTNIGLAGLKLHQKKFGFLNSPQEGTDSAEMISKLRVKTPNEQQVVQYLSGGNQQKVVLGKWLSLQPKVLLLDEPTRGIDVGAKQEIYAGHGHPVCEQRNGRDPRHVGPDTGHARGKDHWHAGSR